jgi:stage II sporulation protein D
MKNTFCIIFLCSLVTPHSFASIPKIRVLINKSLKKVTIKGKDIKRTFHFNDNVARFPGRKVVKFNCDRLKGKISFDKPQVLASLASNTGLITVGDKKFKGSLHILTAQNNKSCDVVYESSIDDYLSSLLTKEMNATWPIEALKAQAIAARTYALHKMKSKQVSIKAGYDKHYHLESSEKHQVAGQYFDATKETRKATKSTRGYVLVGPKGKMNPVFFHAKCGGRTLVPEDVWQNKVLGYKSVTCKRCNKKVDKKFRERITKKRFTKFLNWAKINNHISKKIKIGKRPSIYLLKDYDYGRRIRLYVNNVAVFIKKSVARRYFGRVIVPSNNFVLRFNKKRSTYSIVGRGNGHGVGMCQMGALDLAQKGWSYKKILAHYYPNHKLKKVY